MRLDETFLPVGAVAPAMRADAVRVGAVEKRSLVLGPGERFVVWVAGCLRRCPGCMKPELFSFGAGEWVGVEELVVRIMETENLEGVTFSGGEPFEQAESLARVARAVRERGLSVLVYSGYRREALEREERFAPLLGETDILIDGEYRRDLPGPYAWRGSGNQVVHALTSRGACVEPDRAARNVQVSLTVEGLRLSGFPDEAMERALAERLAARGIEMRAVKHG